jgi:hypothetical protein
MSPRALSLRQKSSLTLLMMRNVSTATKKGHWFMNCKKYLKEQKKKKGTETSTSSINVIKLVLQYLLVTHGFLIPDR